MQAYAGSASIGLQWISLIILKKNEEKSMRKQCANKKNASANKKKR
jgi:hypothetical protein